MEFKMKTILFSVVAAAGLMIAPAEAHSKLVPFRGEVTAVNSNGYKPGLSFTAKDANGRVKMFYIASLKHLDVNDRVVLKYADSDRFPLNVHTIKFLQPAK